MSVLNNQIIHKDKDKFTIKTSQDVTDIINKNKSLLAENNDGYSPSREMKRVASIPLIFLELWAQEYFKKEKGIQCNNWLAIPKEVRNRLLKQKLNDPSNKFLRVSNGTI